MEGIGVQNAKDTFFEALRARVAAANPERTVVVRNVTRAGVVVEENELAVAGSLLDCFRLRWMDLSVDTAGAMPLVVMTCVISYATEGSAANAGMDRGRGMAAMDAELAAAVNGCPQHAVKQDFAALAHGGAAAAMGTAVWWSDAVFSAVKTAGVRLERTAVVTVMSYGEAGEW